MKWICVMAGVLSMAAYAASGQAATIEECPVPPGAVKVALPSGLPPAVRKAMGNIALPGEPFDASDLYVKGHKNSRYIFVWNIGNRWIVATEQGGIALRAGVFIYDLGKDGKTAALSPTPGTVLRRLSLSANTGAIRPSTPKALIVECPRIGPKRTQANG